MLITSTIFLLGCLPLIIAFLVMRNGYTQSTYRKETNNAFMKVMKDTGLIGEYYTAKKLDKIPGYHKMLVNAYIPKEKGGTTEIDVLFLHETGIYVLESKNYSGWIFGKESDKSWTQTFPNGKKQSFYNPIMQNKGHIKALLKLLTIVPEEHVKSLIIFSKRCELKKITVDSTDVVVLKRNDLKKLINQQIKKIDKVMSKEEIDQLYATLKPYTQVGEDVKEKHVGNIEKIKRG
jgi:hypothetical protein